MDTQLLLLSPVNEPSALNVTSSQLTLTGFADSNMYIYTSVMATANSGKS